MLNFFVMQWFSWGLWFSHAAVFVMLHMMTSLNGKIFRATSHLCVEITGHRWFPSQRPMTRSSDVFIHLCLNNGWINNREAGNLRRHSTHYDVIVMIMLCSIVLCTEVRCRHVCLALHYWLLRQMVYAVRISTKPCVLHCGPVTRI